MSNDLIAAQIKNLRAGQHKRQCPACQGTRGTNKRDRPLSVRVTADGVQYHCHHCGESGGWYNEKPKHNYYEPVRYQEAVVLEEAAQNEHAVSYLEERGISREVMDDHAILGEWTFGGERKAAIGFPYRDNQGQVVSVKWRSANGTKQFSQQGVCEDFFNVENYRNGNDLLICEGEMDALSWMTAGLPENITVVSIPNGAPPKVKDGKIDPADDQKFRYIYRSKDVLDSAPRIILPAKDWAVKGLDNLP
jgi:twinkle protein